MAWKELLGVVVLLLLTPACAETIPLHGDVSLDSGFSPQETEEILSAADQWRRSTGLVSLNFHVSDDAGASEFAIVRRSGLNPDRGLTTRTDGGVLIEIWPADIYNSPFYEQGVPGYGSVEQVALHEMGHAFGLPHLGHGLMHKGGPNPDGSPQYVPACIDGYTLQKFCDLYGCVSASPTCG